VNDWPSYFGCMTRNDTHNRKIATSSKSSRNTILAKARDSAELDVLRASENRDRPFGQQAISESTAQRLGLAVTFGTCGWLEEEGE
jgi:hypothetical protein